MTDDDIEHARATLEQLEAAKKRKDAISVRRANYDFHFSLYEKADTPILIETAQKLWTRFPWDVLSVVPQRREASIVEHDRILAAMVTRDSDATAAACADHLTQSYIDIERYLGHPSRAIDPFPFDGLALGQDRRMPPWRRVREATLPGAPAPHRRGLAPSLPRAVAASSRRVRSAAGS